MYGEPKVLPIPEEHPTNPVSPYGIAMLTCEKCVLSTARMHGLKPIIVRCANAYGENQPANRPQGLIAVLIDRLARFEPVTIYGDGSAVRDFVYIDDVAEAVVDLIVTTQDCGIVNLGSGIGTSLSDVLLLIESVCLAKFSVVYERPRAIDVPTNVLDIAKLQRLINFTPIPLKLGIARTWERRLSDRFKHTRITGAEPRLTPDTSGAVE